MATPLTRAVQHRPLLQLRGYLTARRDPARRVRDDRHPAVALAIVLPCAAVLLLLFGGWEQMATQTKAVADLIGR
ncbi:hypothetical protein C7C46_23060 [Streptomyces tateyamensis]|uniref:Uncharacterized protein n=1 Tax=Streptomyces tateyamensis TaxID=565073 RepID=A0A2V4NXK6_9ACTN|nr:hypothetical protein [Streptomyces tateyamensis]PYC76347.1 hypothetical protein C7C46_23060 [Streptomyces tateyamensis]